MINLKAFAEKYLDGKYADIALDEEREKRLCEALGIEYIPPKPDSVWELDDYDNYWLLEEDGHIHGQSWDGSEWDEKYRAQGNLFLTKEEAEAEAERRAVETLLLKYGGRRTWKPDCINDLIEFNGKSLLIDSELCPYAGGIYFDDMAEAVHAIEEIGEERIIKALFRTEEEK